ILSITFLQAASGDKPCRISSTTECEPATRITSSPCPVDVQAPTSLSTNKPAPIIGESPNLPRILKPAPLVVQLPLRVQKVSIATIPIVSWFHSPLSNIAGAKGPCPFMFLFSTFIAGGLYSDFFNQLS